jgi:hypothetical protein
MEGSAGRNYHDCTVLAPASHLKSDRIGKKIQIAALSNFINSIHNISIKITFSHDWLHILTLLKNLLSNNMALLQLCENLEHIPTLKSWLMLMLKSSNVSGIFHFVQREKT